ncbi:histidine kinase [Marinobacter sp.]|uniref:histidine kinase n=1 Tax=Marinobacter sp. TaxID=50741 RepID=UPI00356AD88E
MDSSLQAISAEKGIHRFLWPGLWVPAVILILGVALSLPAARLASTLVKEQAHQLYQAQHQALANLIASQLQSKENDFTLLKETLARALPEHLNLRVDTLDRHTKQPILELGSTKDSLSRQSLRSELDLTGGRWMVTTLPGAELLISPAQSVRRRVLFCGLAITLLGVVLSLFLCRRNGIKQQLARNLEKDVQVQNQKIANLNIEKTALRQALNDSETRSRDLVRLSGTLIAELDSQGRIGFISDLAVEMLGRAPSDLGQTPFQDLVAETDQQRFLECLNASISDHDIARADLTLIGKNAEQTVPVALRIKALKEPVRGITGYRLSAQAINPAA